MESLTGTARNVPTPRGSVEGPPSDQPVEPMLFANDRTRVLRVTLPDGTVAIRKETSGPGAAGRVEHEKCLLDRLAGIAGVPAVLASSGPRVLTTQDVGGRPLDAVLAERGRLEPTEVISLGAGLAEILAAVHAAGVVHRDLHPGNVLLAPDGTPFLVDFDLATTFAELRPAFTHHTEILGRLPYLAPEQTGRTGLAVDVRSDLYGLGAVLHEAATGHPPVAGEDPLDLIRGILTQVPKPLSAAAPGTPALLCDLVARLLEKEPDRRYASAAGVAHDLRRLASDPTRTFPLGERDFPCRLTAPTRLVGREEETAVLAAALSGVVRTDRSHRPDRALLVCGAAGIGKSALIGLLRPMVTQRGGWFVSGKFDQVLRGSSDGLLAALRGLANLLLALPPAALEEEGRRALAELGTNAGILGALVPELGQALGLPADRDAAESLEAQARTHRAVVDLLRAVASPQRPLVIFLDDLQWAAPSALDVIDALLHDDALSGLLLVGAYRDHEVDPAHPLVGMLSRWERLGVSPTAVTLAPLAPDDLAELLAQILRLPIARSVELAGVVGERTHGNPFDTIELLNAMRRDGVLVLGPDGWSWDADAVQRLAGQADVVELLRARIDRLPPDAQDLITAMAGLGSQVSTEFLAQATGRTATEAAQALAAPLEEGLLVAVDGPRSGEAQAGESGLAEVRFRHDRVQQAAHQHLDDDARRALQAVMARRLVAAGQDGAAAAQFLAADVAPANADERALIVRLYSAAADRERSATNHTSAEQYLAAACRLHAEVAAEDDLELVSLETAHHAALFQLGRLDEADTVYASIRRRCSDPVRLVPATGVQVACLTRRTRAEEAVALGLELLARLGMPFPAGEQAPAVVGRGIADVAEWAATLSLADDLARPPMRDQQAVAIASIVNRMSAPAFFAAPLVSAWLVAESRRLWQEYGPSADLILALAHATVACVAVLDAYRPGDLVTRHVIAVGEAHGWEVSVAEARFLHGVSSAHWFEPLESCLAEARVGREGLLHLGDLSQASMASFPCVNTTAETAPTLDDVIAEADASIALSSRTANLLSLTCFTVVRQFCRAAAGHTESVTTFGEPGVDEAGLDELGAAIPLVAQYLQLYRGVTAALIGDAGRLADHAAAAFRSAQGLPGLIFIQLATVPYGVHLGDRLQATDVAGPEHAEALGELEALLAWARARAEDTPENLLHVVRLLEAERAWGLRDPQTAARAFDAALLGLRRTSRPWQLALVARRAGEFHRAHGLEHTGRLHLALSRQVLADWGASALVAELDRAYPFLTTGISLAGGGSGAGVSTSGSASRGLTSDAIDMMAILRAAEALASQTALRGLHETLVEQLRSITGATQVHLVLRDGPEGPWCVVGSSTPDGADLDLDDPAAGRVLPVSAVRYTLRTTRPLLVDDALRDDRFARDPYFADAPCCALLGVPVAQAGAVRAVLLLENRLTSGAFTAARLDSVTMLTGQLATALENARLYASLEERIAARTEELRAANSQLEQLAVTDALTGVANRRHFDIALAAEWDRAFRTGRPVALLMIDIDHFKRYNDHFGHQAGDACLAEVGRCLGESIRGSDVLCRYGGEEFAVILPRADLDAATIVGERARAALRAAGLDHTPEIGQVTVSIGAACLLPSAGESPSHLVRCADGALYEAKRAGRDRVVAHRPGDDGAEDGA